MLVLAIIYGKEWNPNSLSRLSIVDWIAMIVVAALLGALAPAMFFFALEQTTVNNVVLISRIEPPLTLLLSILFLKTRINTKIAIGAISAFMGVMLTIVLQPSTEPNVMAGGGDSFRIGQGEIMTAVGAIASAIAGIISKIKLDKIPRGIFAIFRTALGTVIFFSLTAKLYGVAHFMDVFAPILWQWSYFTV